VGKGDLELELTKELKYQAKSETADGECFLKTNAQGGDLGEGIVTYVTHHVNIIGGGPAGRGSVREKEPLSKTKGMGQ